MLDTMMNKVQEMENSDKRSKSVPLPFRCPLAIYRLLYYYMKDKENNVSNKAQAICDLIELGFNSYSMDKNKNKDGKGD